MNIIKKIRLVIIVMLFTPLLIFSQKNKNNYKIELVATCVGLSKNYFRCNIATAIVINVYDSNTGWVIKALSPKSYRAILIRNNHIILDIKATHFHLPDIINEMAIKGDICIVMDVKLKDRKYKLPKGKVLVLHPKLYIPL